MRSMLLFVCVLLGLSLTSCAKKRLKHKYTKGDKGQNHRSLEIGNVDNRQLDVAVDVDKMFLVVRRESSRRRTVDPICRGVEGCLHICGHLKHHSECKQLLVHQVVNFWVNQISQYPNWDLAQKDLHLIATNQEVASFLKKVDSNHHVIKSLLRLGSSAYCPISMNLGVQHAPFTALYIAQDQTPKQDQTPNVELDQSSSDQTSSLAPLQTEKSDLTVLSHSSDESVTAPEVATAPETESVVSSVDKKNVYSAWDHTVEKRKVIDSSITPFDVTLFFSLIKKCFGQEPQRTFFDVAIEIENRPAFDMAHEVLSSACHGNSECIRLAYCDINSPLVWDQIDPKYKEAGCKYDSFIEPIPQTQESEKPELIDHVHPLTISKPLPAPVTSDSLVPDSVAPVPVTSDTVVPDSVAPVPVTPDSVTPDAVTSDLNSRF